VEISFGALAPKLTVQLKGALPHRELKVFDDVAHAIIDLHIGGILSDGEAHKARRRLLKKIEMRWRKHNEKLAKRHQG